MTDQIDTAGTVVTSIREGQYDNELELIASTVRFRQKVIALQAGQALRIGDTVEFNNKARPQYLIGTRATVTKVMQSWVMLQLEEPTGRFSGNNVRTPMTIIEKV